MLDFVNNFYLDSILIILMLINFCLVLYYDILRYKKEKIFQEENQILNFKLMCLIFWIIIFAILIFILFKNIIYLIIYIIGVIFTIKNIFNKSSSNELSGDEIHYFLLSSGFYYVLFSPFSSLNILKIYDSPEYLILVIAFKIIVYVFSAVTSIFLLLYLIQQSQHYKDFKRKISHWNIDKIVYEIKDRNVNTKKDKFIYFFYALILIFQNLFKIAKIKLSRAIKKVVIKLVNLVEYFTKNKNKLIKLAITISIVLSLIITYIIIIQDKSCIITSQLKDIYEILATVILIPISFNVIISLAKKQNN